MGQHEQKQRQGEDAKHNERKGFNRVNEFGNDLRDIRFHENLIMIKIGDSTSAVFNDDEFLIHAAGQLFSNVIRNGIG